MLPSLGSAGVHDVSPERPLGTTSEEADELSQGRERVSCGTVQYSLQVCAECLGQTLPSSDMQQVQT